MGRPPPHHSGNARKKTFFFSWCLPLAYLIKFSVSGNNLESIYLKKKNHKIWKKKEIANNAKHNDWGMGTVEIELSSAKLGNVGWNLILHSRGKRCRTSNMATLGLFPFLAKPFLALLCKHGFVDIFPILCIFPFFMKWNLWGSVSALFTLSAGTTTHAIPYIQI